MAKDPVKKTRPRRGEATRERIVAAAVEAFSERGFDAASTRDIAQRAGTDQGLVTYHFPNKDQLWRAAADRIFGLLGKRLDEAVASLEFEDRQERSRGVIRAYVRFAAAHPELFRFLVAEGNRASARMRWLADTYLRPRFEYMKSEGIVPAAGIEKSDAAHALYALTGAASLIFAVAPACRRVTGVDPKRKEAVEAHADFVARLMVP